MARLVSLEANDIYHITFLLKFLCGSLLGTWGLCFDHPLIMLLFPAVSAELCSVVVALQVHQF